ncbi:spore coat protein U domain-containing protein [Pseudomonas typographi]|uniref:Fimbrial major subunit CsuA/B family protein n=1 Tax=Pseudomonas typographi TaxID=2715964 RepID=A0ABR7YY76_9PSED|nr:fimbrial major subunit CsuA/B family protein [Pseudomonas typographi]MBD1598115.1 fimbrial major subunit CsuA/B family protein [Pseudomonas typographi]
MVGSGVQGRLWNERAQADLAGVSTNTLSVTCNRSVTGFMVAIDRGVNGDGSNRRLSNGTRMVPYKLYLDAARQNDHSIGQRDNLLSTLACTYRSPSMAPWNRISALPEGVYLHTRMVMSDWY